MRRLLCALIVCAVAPAAARAAAQDAGRTVFQSNCSVCHAPQAGTNKIGPSLAGVVGRPAGSLPDYSYSAAMRHAGRNWDQANLQAFLSNPRGTVPGTKMVFPGLHQFEQRDALIAYLQTLK